MSAVNSKSAISQVNQTMLSNLNIKTEQTASFQKTQPSKALGTPKAAVPSPAADSGEGDTLTIGGKTIKKKTAVIGAIGALGIILAIGAAIKNGVSKGKITLPWGKKNAPKPAPKGGKPSAGGKKPVKNNPAKPDTLKPKNTKKPSKKGKKAPSGTKQTHTPNPKTKAPKPQNPAPETIIPQKTPEQIRAEIEAEVKRRAEAERKMAETSRIAQDYFFDLNDSSTGKSARESGLFLQRALKLDERGLSGLSETSKKALSRDFTDYLAVSTPSTRGQMKRIARNAAKMEQEFTPEEIKKLSGSKFYIKTLLCEYLRGIEDPKGRAEIVEFLHTVAKM